MSATRKQILILAANPQETKPLMLKQEETNIVDVLNRARLRDAFELLPPCRGVTPREMQEKILNQEPHIVHFSGHGGGTLGIALEDQMGNVKPVTAEALAGLFELCDQVECVILNACHSHEQARAIARHVPYVIGMKQTIGDRAALEFAFGFYTALGAGKDYDLAYKNGCNAIRMEGVAGSDIPVLTQRPSLNATPILRIYGWEECPSSEAATETLNWTSYYNKKPYKIPTPEIWETELLPRLISLKKEWARTYTRQHLSLRGTIPLSVALFIGYLFPWQGGYTADIEQNTSGRPAKIWHSTSASSLRFTITEEQGSGEDLLVVFSIARDAQPAARKLIQENPDQFGQIIFAEPETGISSTAIESGEDAVALAIHGKQLMDKYHKTAPRIHIIMAAPMGFALFLGQQLNAFGEIMSYEYVQDNNTYRLAIQWFA